MSIGRSRKTVLRVVPKAARTPTGREVDVHPPSMLDDNQLEVLQERLRDCMPLDTMITDLWSWDLRFEELLDYDWYFDAVFGDESCVDGCSEQLAAFFFEKCDEYGMDYGQSHVDFCFETFVREEARKFITGWRRRLADQCGGHADWFVISKWLPQRAKVDNSAVITRGKATEIAKADALAHALGVEVLRVMSIKELGERAPNLYAPSLDNCWIAYIQPPGLLDLPDIRSSTIVAIDRDDGRIVYRGSAGDEG